MRHAAAFFAGAASVLAFAPAGLYPILPVSFAVLAYLWMEPRPRACFWTGAAFGLGLFGAGVSWVYVSLSEFGGMPPLLAGGVTAALCALLAVFPALAGWLQARIPASGLVRALFLIPSCWTLFEWLRGWLFSGFPWLSAGYAAPSWPMEGFAPLLGVYGITWLTLFLAGGLWCMVSRRQRIAAAVLCVALIGAGEALRTVAWTQPTGAPFNIALLQGNIEQDLKFRPERYAQILETYASLAEGSGARLIVLPETAIPRFFDRIDPAYLARLQATAAQNDGDLLLGVPFRATDTQYYNSVLTLGRSRPQAYHKVHLVPFGEYMPAGFHWALRLLDIPLADFSAGAPDQPPLKVADQRIAVNICYEDAFGAEIAARARDATLLVNVSNVAWFGDSLAPGQHLQIARLRALETGRMHLAATNTGITAAIDRDGRVLARLPQFTEGRLELAAQGYAGVTPYLRAPDWPVLAASLALLALAVLRARRRR
ncbi:MAG TPA: apolipoprotein N-acyltransferase [Burkholderiales bacterium]|nr:apolipoprotein N-acyltransferase [Burkholderiales bacterium]